MEDSAQSIVPEAPTRLWIPGLGVVDPAVRKVARAVKQYDEALNLARHEITGDWVITIGENSHPVYGFGRELPNPEDVERILSVRDVKRNGKRILDQLARDAERARLDAEYRAEEADEAVAEGFAYLYAKYGDKRAPRIFVPRGL